MGNIDLRLACVITCHNRREKTLKCIAALFSCRRPLRTELQVILVDDGSSDGTFEAVRNLFPQVQVIRGDGSLFWNGGMRKGFAAAIEQRFDDYLWLNDDTTLDVDALERLYACRDAVKEVGDAISCIVVGATRDPVTGQLSYGGLVPSAPDSPNQLVTLPVGTVPQRCKTLNGNCVLISSDIVHALGNLDENFVHAIGDWDYGLRATAAGFGVWMAPGFVGVCERNAPTRLPAGVARSVRARLRYVCSPKQVPPRAWFTYVRRNYGPLWPIEFAKPYASAVIGALAAKLRGPAS